MYRTKQHEVYCPRVPVQSQYRLVHNKVTSSLQHCTWASGPGRTPMEGSVTSGSGEGEEGVKSFSSPSSTSPNHYQALHHTQMHPLKQPPINSSTQSHPVKHSPTASPTQMHPVKHSPRSSSTQVHPVSTQPSTTLQHFSQTSAIQSESHLHVTNGEACFPLHPKTALKSSSAFSKHDKPRPKELLASRHLSKKSPKKSSSTKSTPTRRTSPRLSGVPAPKGTEIHTRSAVPTEPTILNGSLTLKEASTSTGSPLPKASPVHRPSSSEDTPASVPKVSPTHKTSPTHTPGSSSLSSSSTHSSPTKERHIRRFINANMAASEEEEVEREPEAGGTIEEKKEKMREMMQSNGTQMRAIMEQEIQRLSLQKRDVVMRDRVVGE